MIRLNIRTTDQLQQPHRVRGLTPPELIQRGGLRSLFSRLRELQDASLEQGQLGVSMYTTDENGLPSLRTQRATRPRPLSREVAAQATGGAAAGAATIVALWALGTYAPVDLPATVQGAVLVLATIVLFLVVGLTAWKGVGRNQGKVEQQTVRKCQPFDR